MSTARVRGGWRLALAAVSGALLVAACGGAAPGTGAPPPPTPTASASPTAPPPGSPSSAISHPSGAADLVLRFSEGGGFVAPGFLAVELPLFTLYGDGTVLYRSSGAAPIPQGPGDPVRMPPLAVARMAEEEVQALLADGLGQGGLAIAGPRYSVGGVADAPTAVFELDAGGLRKRVEVYGLGIGDGTGPDGAILARLAAFADRLRSFDADVRAGHATPVGTYQPARFRASLVAGGFVNVPARHWPWPTFGPDAFVPLSDPSLGPLPSKVLSAAEAGLLGIPQIEGGAAGIPLLFDGTVYQLAIRPLLPDETR